MVLTPYHAMCKVGRTKANLRKWSTSQPAALSAQYPMTAMVLEIANCAASGCITGVTGYESPINLNL